MDRSAQGAIVVGVTGPGREEAALRYAAECARREGAEVVLVHAFRVTTPAPPPSVLITYADAADVAERIVKDVGEEFGQLTGGSVEYRTVAVGGHPGRVLVDLSHGARMVVVQHRSVHGLGRFFVGSTATVTAAHAACPVISVAHDWQSADAPGEVVAGVHEGGEPREVLDSAFSWAATTGVPLRIVHAWRLDAAYDDLISAADAAQWREEQTEALASAVAGLRERHPDVPVTLEVRHQWPVDVLVDDSRGASLVVVGRHGSRSWAPERLGSLARTVIRESKSPVMVVPVHPHEDGSKDWGLVADDISPQT